MVGHSHARNQIGTLGGAKNFLTGAQIAARYCYRKAGVLWPATQAQPTLN